MADPYQLERFVTAQEPVIDSVVAELRAGAKRSHWMWFVFPQLAELGLSATSKFYGLASRNEALAYWQHATLGPRLLQCCSLLLPHRGIGAERVLGPVDAMKLRSCLTLFEQVAPEQPVFAQLLDAFYGGQRDASTAALLRGEPPPG
jgi:uncharacterized protein (DUF1810 family)